MSETSLIFIIITTALVSNVVLSQFLGICSFLGVSKSVKNSAALGVAVIFVITIASAVANLLYQFLLKPFQLEYLETIVFILVIAALVQIVEMFLKKSSPAIYNALGIYLPSSRALPPVSEPRSATPSRSCCWPASANGSMRKTFRLPSAAHRLCSWPQL